MLFLIHGSSYINSQSVLVSHARHFALDQQRSTFIDMWAVYIRCILSWLLDCGNFRVWENERVNNIYELNSFLRFCILLQGKFYVVCHWIHLNKIVLNIWTSNFHNFFAFALLRGILIFKWGHFISLEAMTDVIIIWHPFSELYSFT
jgi:hypothetical protein